MPYPVAYRTGNADAGAAGFQSAPAPSPAPPANDNAPRYGGRPSSVGRPANDNTPGTRRPGGRRLPGRLPHRLHPLAAAAFRRAAMLSPALAAAYYGYQYFFANQIVPQSVTVGELLMGDYAWYAGVVNCAGGAILIPSLNNRLNCGSSPYYWYRTEEPWDNPPVDQQYFIGVWDPRIPHVYNGLDQGIWDYYGTLYRTVASGSATMPEWVPGGVIAPQPDPATDLEVLPWPQLDPMSQPIHRARPEPAHLPISVVPYLRPENPNYAPGNGPLRGPVPVPATPPEHVTVEVTDPYSPPTASASSPVRRPPGPRTREKKARLLRAWAPFNRVLSSVTEGLDFIDAVFYALPANRRWGAYTPQAKLARIWKHYDEIDIEQALLNLLINEIQDRVIGSLASAAARAEKPYLDATGRTVSSQAGPAI